MRLSPNVRRRPLSGARFGFKKPLEIHDSSAVLAPEALLDGLAARIRGISEPPHALEESIMSAEPMQTSDVIGLTKVAPFSRRGFMTATAAVTAGYTLAAGPVRADVIKTGTDGLTAGEAKIRVADGEMPGYFARPNGVSNPPVVLVAMEVFGLHEYIRDVTRRLAKLGAFAVAPDYYFRKGDLIGFCRGGRTVWEYAAHNAGLKAGVAFYGPPVDPPNRLWPKSPTQLAPEMKAPVLGLYGEADTGIPVASVEAL